MNRSILTTSAATAAAAALLVSGGSAAVAAPPSHAGPGADRPAGPAAPQAQTARTPLERQVLAEGDGWASAGDGTTGGSAASQEQVHDVSSRAELVDALETSGDEPTIIRVHGVVDAATDDDGGQLTCSDYAVGTGYSLEEYLAAYDPETWGWEEEPSGALEEAREAAEQNQKEHIRWDIPSNTTIVGATPEAEITGAALRIDGEENVILRNLTISDSKDCFPSWDPTDGDAGNWNSEYDMLQIINGAEHVWLDHNTFTDAPTFDDELPAYFGRTYQMHDGAVDVTNGSNLVTMSYNSFEDHDKLMLIGSTDSADRGDPGKLKVTIHHNRFTDVGQRAPRVRWGQVDVYNNHFVTTDDSPVDYSYLFGVGNESHLHAEANAIEFRGDDGGADEVIKNWRGEVYSGEDNLVDGQPVDLLDAHNAAVAEDQQLDEDTSWTPQLRGRVDAPQAVPALLSGNVGPIYTVDGAEED
ncbi:polysaccharide lyase family 1 protein [Nesterenkonia sp. F]|uniref:pectate lyase family protein n=1 Tax=Nesterenkonia sp. F TaxID=795955 RepID=UPI000255C928|nr:pectate lyase [Nesterenkonia sp. F]